MVIASRNLLSKLNRHIRVTVSLRLTFWIGKVDWLSSPPYSPPPHPPTPPPNGPNPSQKFTSSTPFMFDIFLFLILAMFGIESVFEMQIPPPLMSEHICCARTHFWWRWWTWVYRANQSLQIDGASSWRVKQQVKLIMYWDWIKYLLRQRASFPLWSEI